MKKHNKHLAEAAKNAGVLEPIDYAIFQDHGYRGLYGWFRSKRYSRKKRAEEKSKNT